MAEKYKHEDTVGLQSEFNMSVLDMERLDNILRKVDEFAISCGEGTFVDLIPYLHSLSVFLNYMIPLMNKGNRKRYEEAEMFLNNILFVHKQYNWDTYMKLKIWHRQLLVERQKLGLGVYARRDEEYAEKFLASRRKK